MEWDSICVEWEWNGMVWMEMVSMEWDGINVEWDSLIIVLIHCARGPLIVVAIGEYFCMRD